MGSVLYFIPPVPVSFSHGLPPTIAVGVRCRSPQQSCRVDPAPRPMKDDFHGNLQTVDRSTAGSEQPA
jgi:hypothetical protein